MRESSPVASAALPRLLLLFLLCATPIFATDFWNIDCGGNETFVNANNLTFEGDAPYIHTGVAREAPDADKNGIPREISTMRVFPAEAWKKSCYRVPVEQGTKVLVRTRFYYGNYDGLNSPPKFDVHFDTAESCSVTTDLVLNSSIFCEFVYVTTKKQGTDICFVRTESNQFPIVSTIEVRRLPSNMYGLLDFNSHALFRRRKFAFGADRYISYPNDAYNRNWTQNNLKGIKGTGIYNPIIVKRDNATAVDTRSADDLPPALLFDAAVVAPMVSNQTAANVTIPMPWLPTSVIDIYFAMYFTEPVASGGTSAQKKRIFDVYAVGKLISNASDPIQPRYGFAKEFSATLRGVSNDTAFVLVPAEGSTLPPAISGMEVFSIHDIDRATDSNDVEVLSTLQSSFTVFRNWSGDPCQPSDYIWEWVGCKYPDASPPRINKLLLSGYKLSGDIPDLSSLDALEYIDLSNNSFTGSVPKFITSLPNLQTLDLSFNDFDGIPTSLSDRANFTLITRGNPKLLASNTSSAGSSGTTPTSSASTAYYKAQIYSLSVFSVIVAITAMD